MNTIINKKSIAFLALLLGAMVILVGCNTGDTDGTVISKTDANINTTTEVVEESNTNTAVEVAVNTNNTEASEVVNEETNTTEETIAEEKSDIPADWVKYENEEYRFSFYHPDSYRTYDKTEQNSGSNSIGKLYLAINSEQMPPYDHSISIRILEKNVEELISHRESSIESSSNSVLVSKDIKEINGQYYTSVRSENLTNGLIGESLYIELSDTEVLNISYSDEDQMYEKVVQTVMLFQ